MKSFKKIYHYLLSAAGALMYGFPSRKIAVIGVTGTKGKSTTVELLSFIFESAGISTACLSSIRVKIGSHTEKNLTDNTMPGRFFIQRFLRDAVRAKCGVAFIEVTSQGIPQYRHRFIDFDVAVMLNLRPEHIESHGSFENYRDAKVRFFRDVAKHSAKPAKQFFVNEEDPAADRFADAAHASGMVCFAHVRPVRTAGRQKEEEAPCNAEIRYFGRDRFIETKLMRGRVSIGDWLTNDFNLENAAAAAAVAEARGISWETIRTALAAFSGIPGRMEFIQREPFGFIVDYAHTPDSLQAAYRAVRSRYLKKSKKEKLICILGSAGGGRDRWKRPEMGKVAATHCDTVILTNEDPHDEDAHVILDEVAAGFSGVSKGERMEILDRREAVREAIARARAGDMVIITGKGSEAWMHLAGGKRIPWNERRVIEEELARAKM